MTIDLVLVAWFFGSLAFLAAVETATVALGVPTISERVQTLGRKAVIVVIWASFACGFLLDHFFEVHA